LFSVVDIYLGYILICQYRSLETG